MKKNQISRGAGIYLGMSLLVVIFLILFFSIPKNSYRLSNRNGTILYYADNISNAHQILINRFNKANKGRIQVQSINLPFEKFSTNERKELLARSLRSQSDRIDVFTVDVIWVPRFTKWCYPLDPHFDIPFRNQLLKNTLESCTYNDELVAIPLYTDIGLMYYRKDIVDRLPDAVNVHNTLKESITWEEFINLKKKFDKQNITNPFYIYPADNFEGLTCSFFEGIFSQKQNLFDNGSIQLDKSQILRSLRILVDLVHRYRMTPILVTKFDEYNGNLYAVQNDAIFFRGWPGFLEQH
ncbi:extracellular solute-binding protein, partial [bacterium]